MDSIEAHLIQLLDGKTRKSADDVFVDFSLEDQVDELAAKGVESQLKNYKPITKKTVTYIVAAVIINEESEVLMMQEAKSDCAGTWYLPAGRVEPGEDLVSAVRREVQEETGLICEPTSLLMVENAGGSWYRFVFTGTVTGGQLKTVSQADSESLQAKWFSDLNQLDLRSKDILPLVDKALSYWHERSSFHKPMLPALVAHPKLLLRLIVVIRKKENNQIHVLVSNKGSEAHLPVCEINPTRSIHASLKRYMQNMFGALSPTHKPHGLIAIEYNGSYPGEQDGLCLTLLVSCKTPLETAKPSEQYTWLQMSKGAEVQIMRKLIKNMTIALNVIR